MQKCPICDSELNYRIYNDESGRTEECYENCQNDCYHYEFAYGTTRILIFGEEFYEHYSFSEKQQEDVSNRVEKTISYWKDNDRYLMKIMGAD